MSLTSYRAAPPRDKPLRALVRAGKEPGPTPRGRRSVRSGKLPEKATRGECPLGASGMYQCSAALERAGRHVFEDFIRRNVQHSPENRRREAMAKFGGDL